MKRRKFLAMWAAAAGAGAQGVAFGGSWQSTAFGAGPQGVASGGEAREREILELRIYHFTSAAKQAAYDAFLKNAAIPAANRLGVRPVGVFKLQKSDNPDLKLSEDSTDLYVLLSHKTMESAVTMTERIARDGQFLQAAGEALAPPKSDPAFVRYESSLLLAFTGMPKLEVPCTAPGRIFQLRIYESHSTERHLRKVAMFNEGGEIAIFRKTGLTPVFFGQAIIGSKLPNLTYMVGFDSPEIQKEAWQKFGAHPDWLRLREDPAYKDTVSNITNLILRPAPSSQI